MSVLISGFGLNCPLHFIYYIMEVPQQSKPVARGVTIRIMFSLQFISKIRVFRPFSLRGGTICSWRVWQYLVIDVQWEETVLQPFHPNLIQSLVSDVIPWWNHKRLILVNHRNHRNQSCAFKNCVIEVFPQIKWTLLCFPKDPGLYSTVYTINHPILSLLVLILTLYDLVYIYLIEFISHYFILFDIVSYCFMLYHVLNVNPLAAYRMRCWWCHHCWVVCYLMHCIVCDGSWLVYISGVMLRLMPIPLFEDIDV